ncbi:reverse transcriptase domain-containing protein, partial [Tanacetum coccineum]
MPKYVKFVKDLLSKKGKGSEASKITLNEQCPVVVLNKFHPKEKDLEDEDTYHSANVIDLSILDNIKEILPLNHVNSIEPILDHLPAIHEDCNNPALFAANTNNEEKPTPQLKELPSHLEYAFLDDNHELPNDSKEMNTIAFWMDYLDISKFLWHQKTKKRPPLLVPMALLPIEECLSGHKISKPRIEVDKAKVDVISSLPYPTNVKGIQSFLGHVGFYRRFIKDFSKISRPMTQLFMKDAKFNFSDECIKSFDILRDKLITALVIIAPNWDIDFELMCDVSDYAIGVVLGQRIEKKFTISSTSLG